MLHPTRTFQERSCYGQSVLGGWSSKNSIRTFQGLFLAFIEVVLPFSFLTITMNCSQNVLVILPKKCLTIFLKSILDSLMIFKSLISYLGAFSEHVPLLLFTSSWTEINQSFFCSNTIIKFCFKKTPSSRSNLSFPLEGKQNTRKRSSRVMFHNIQMFTSFMLN